jgi:hypothetical protein
MLVPLLPIVLVELTLGPRDLRPLVDSMKFTGSENRTSSSGCGSLSSRMDSTPASAPLCAPVMSVVSPVTVRLSIIEVKKSVPLLLPWL